MDSFGSVVDGPCGTTVLARVQYINITPTKKILIFSVVLFYVGKYKTKLRAKSIENNQNITINNRERNTENNHLLHFR